MFKNLRIGLRLGIAFAIALLGLSFVAGLGVNRMANLSGQVEVMAKDRFPKTVWANDIIDSINVMARSMRNTLLLKNEADIAKEMARIPQERKTIDDRIEKLTQTVNSAKGKELLQRVKDARAAFLVGQDKLLDMVKKGQRDEAVTYMIGDFRKLQNPYFATVGEIIKFQGALMEEAGREAEATNAASRNLMIGVALSALVFSVLCALWIARSITRPLAESVAAANRLAEGDLTVAITADSTDETGQLKSALQTMIAKLAHTIGEVRGASDQLSKAAQQVSVTSQSLSQAASEQAASIEETTASMEEMTASITQNTENAKVTNNMATQSAQEATEGGVAVRETVEAMKQIAGKIGIIDDIAYQTNLLALNAAIEAARAGEHGKGFAVVAAEVRKLAERSQVAAQEIGELAGSSVKMAEKAGKLLDEMVPSIKKTSDLVQEIAAASSEQSAGVGQINDAMGQLNKATQQNASASEELAATAEEMGGQAGQLQELMAFFTIAEGAAAARAPVARTPAARMAAAGGEGDFARY